MLFEAFLVLKNLAIQQGLQTAWLVGFFLLSLVVFVCLLVATFVYRALAKALPKAPTYFLLFVVTIFGFFLGTLFEIVWYKASFSLLVSFFEPAMLAYLCFVLPLGLFYNRVTEKYPALPWHLTQYLLGLVASTALLGLAIFVFNIVASAVAY